MKKSYIVKDIKSIEWQSQEKVVSKKDMITKHKAYGWKNLV